MANKTQFMSVLRQVASTVTRSSQDFQNREGHRGIRLYLDINGVTGTNPTLDIRLQGKDRVSGNYVNMPGCTFPQKTASHADTTVSLTVYPGIGETNQETISDVLPETWRVTGTIGGTDTPTFNYGISAELLP